jgi:hypothetical protein
MGLKERFNKLIGKEPGPISQREAWRRAVVRNGNLDCQVLPIDRHAGLPIAGRPEQSGYVDRVSDFLERRGIRIERRNGHIPTLIPDQIFDKEVEIAELAHDRRFDERSRGNTDIKQMQDFLRDGAVDGGPKRGGDVR